MKRKDEFDDLLRSIEKMNMPYEPEVKIKGKSEQDLIDELLKELDASDEDNKNNKSGSRSPTKDNSSPNPSSLALKLTKPIQNNISVFNGGIDKGLNMASALDEDLFLQEIEEEEQKEIQTKLALEAILQTNLKKKPTKSDGSDSKYKAPHELVNKQLEDLNEFKESVADALAPSNLLRVQATLDFDPNTMYSEEQASTMLYFKKGNEIATLSLFTADWLAGFCYEKNQENQFSIVKIFPIAYCTLLYHELPKPKRSYEIKYWDMFGALDKQSISDLRSSITQQKTVFKSMQLNHIFKGTDALPKVIHQGIKDFNMDPYVEFAFDKIPLLSFKKGDLIVVTKLANAAGWHEGYVVNRKVIRLGIFHKTFSSQVKFKFN